MCFSPLYIANSISLTQERVTSDHMSTSWPVEGVATVEIGEVTVIGYNMDCTTSANDGQNLSWSRVSASNPFDVNRIANGSQLALQNIEYSNLREYQCVDGANGDVVVLNITTGEYISHPPSLLN